MTIHERMVARSEREKDLLKYGRSQERERIIKLLEPHRLIGKSAGGFLGVCSCGEAIDDYQEHLLALTKGEK